MPGSRTPLPSECHSGQPSAKVVELQSDSAALKISNMPVNIPLINLGFGEYTTPIYYFPCDSGEGGAEFAAHLMRLPSRYLLPGSAVCAPFDMDALAARQEIAAGRTHPMLALGDTDAARFIYELWERGLSRRMVSLAWSRTHCSACTGPRHSHGASPKNVYPTCTGDSARCGTRRARAPARKLRVGAPEHGAVDQLGRRGF